MDHLLHEAKHFSIRDFDCSSNLYVLHQRIVQDSYRALGYLCDEDVPTGILKDPYDNAGAQYALLFDPTTHAPSGTFRIVVPLPEQGLPFHCAYPELRNDEQTHACEPTRVVSTRKTDMLHTPNSIVYSVLFEAVVRSIAFAKKNDLPAVISLGTPPIMRWINGTFGKIQNTVGPKKFYKGGYVIPCRVKVADYEEMTHVDHPIIWEYYSTLVEL